MIELILIVISFVIIIYTVFISKDNNKDNDKNKIFEEVLNEKYKLDSEILLLLEPKKRDFIDKVLNESSKPEKTYSINSIEDTSRQDTNNQKVTILKDMLEDGYDEIEICKALNIGRGEFLLLKNLYKK